MKLNKFLNEDTIESIEAKIKELQGTVQYQREMMEMYLGDVERGIEQIGNLSFHLERMKEAEDEIKVLKDEIKRKELDDEDQ